MKTGGGGACALLAAAAALHFRSLTLTLALLVLGEGASPFSCNIWFTLSCSEGFQFAITRFHLPMVNNFRSRGHCIEAAANTVVCVGVACIDACSFDAIAAKFVLAGLCLSGLIN